MMEKLTERTALDILLTNFDVRSDGMIRAKRTGYSPTANEIEAIEYLFEEHDYGYIPSAGG